MSMVSEQVQLQADLDYVTSVLAGIEQAEAIRRKALHLAHPDYLSQAVVACKDTLEIRKVGLQARLRRAEVLGR